VQRWNPDTIARVTPSLVLFSRDWMSRRKETIEFLDHERLRRSVSIDFTLPGGLEVRVPTGSGLSVFVPLTLLEKRPLRGFSVFDEDGRALPILNRPEHGAICEAMLVQLAETALRIKLGRDVALAAPIRRLLSQIIRGVGQEAQSALGDLLDGRGMSPAWQRNTIRLDGPLRSLAADLSHQFILFVELDEATAGRRRVLKFVYEQELDVFFDKIAQRCAIAPAQISIRAPAVGDAMTYHVEVVCPDDLEITSATLVEAREKDGGADDAPARRRERSQPPPMYRLPNAREPMVGARPHLLTSNQPRGTRAYLELQLRLDPRGLLAAALTIAVFSFLVLTTGAILGSFGRHAEGEVAAAVLVALPAAAAAYLTRPGEHRLVTRLVSGVRMLLLGVATLSIAAAATLAVDFCHAARLTIWWVASGLSLLIATLLGIAFVRARRALRSSSSSRAKLAP
jgi:hypothetical protein